MGLEVGKSLIFGEIATLISVLAVLICSVTSNTETIIFNYFLFLFKNNAILKGKERVNIIQVVFSFLFFGCLFAKKNKHPGFAYA